MIEPVQTHEQQDTYNDFIDKLEKVKIKAGSKSSVIKKELKHNYTSELELKSLLIRIKNERQDIGFESEMLNNKINKYIKWHTDISRIKYENPTKRNVTKSKLKTKIISLSEQIKVNKTSYEIFGQIILLMVKNILKKPQFSGYTYKDDFYSDAVYKILKYLHNFDHTKTSLITGFPVNAFAYISQIIHNSILYILNKKKKERTVQDRQIDMEHLNHNLELKYKTYYNETSQTSYDDEVITKKLFIDTISPDNNLVGELSSLIDEINIIDNFENFNVTDFEIVNIYNEENEIVKIEAFLNKTDNIKISYPCELSSENSIKIRLTNYTEIIYPNDYRITFDEYNELKKLLNGNISILRKPDEIKETEEKEI